jgi:hypothetical protein
MKKLPFLCATILFSTLLFSQSHTLKYGTFKKAITILPTTPNDDGLVLAPKPVGQNIVLVGGSMNPLTNDGNDLILPNSNSVRNTGTQAPLLSTPNQPKQKTTSVNSQKSTSVYTQSLTDNNNSLTSLTDYSTNNSKSFKSNNDNSSSSLSLTYTPNSVAQTSAANISLEPLTYTAPKTKVQTALETLDPSRINAGLYNSTNSQKTFANTYFKNISQETLPPRNSISKTKMPELAAIEGAAEAKNGSNGLPQNQKNGMPELAPIEDQNNPTTQAKQSLMPELAPLEDEQSGDTKQTNNQNQDLNQEKTNKVRGFLIPKGTLLKANQTKSYIIKPAAPIKNIVLFTPNDSDELIGAKTSAGGGIGFTTNEDEINENYISLTDLVATPIQNNQTQQQLQQAAKNHQHDPNNPCCRVQMSKVQKKNFANKRPVYRKKKTYIQQPVVYAYKKDPVKTKNIERIVYMPVQQTPQQQKQAVQVNKPQVVSQPVQQTAKSQEKIIYRDYTNTYSKANPSSQSENIATNKDNKKYYNPNNYASGLNSGPTSGDYPVSGNSSDVDLQYTFYVNPKGAYGVSIFNNNCSVLLQQNGKVIEFKVYGSTKKDQPKLNYFGSPENIAGIPIEYNYNRTIHKIGNIKFDYDFEGFFKAVGNSKVFYTSRSTLLRVDNTNVRYNASNNVTSVDQNNGILQYNP